MLLALNSTKRRTGQTGELPCLVVITINYCHRPNRETQPPSCKVPILSLSEQRFVSFVVVNVMKRHSDKKMYTNLLLAMGSE